MTDAPTPNPTPDPTTPEPLDEEIRYVLDVLTGWVSDPVTAEEKVAAATTMLTDLLPTIERLEGEGAAALLERTAQLSAHRVCIGLEHDPANGKLHGCCVVCAEAWPCTTAKDARTTVLEGEVERLREALAYGRAEAAERLLLYRENVDLLAVGLENIRDVSRAALEEGK